MVLSVPSGWAVFEVGTRIVVGGLLIARGAGMMGSVSAWRQVWLAAHQLLPARLVGPVALLLPVAELLAGIMFLLGAFGPVGAIAAASVLALTTLAAGVALGRGLTLAAGGLCRLHPLLYPYTLLRNALFVAAASAVAVHGSGVASVAVLGPWPQTALVLTVAGMAGALIVALRRAHQQRTTSGVSVS